MEWTTRDYWSGVGQIWHLAGYQSLAPRPIMIRFFSVFFFLFFFVCFSKLEAIEECTCMIL